jgi:hypothetical protein
MAKRKKTPKTRWDGERDSAGFPRYKDDPSNVHSDETAGFLTPEEDYDDLSDKKIGDRGHLGGSSGYYDDDYDQSSEQSPPWRDQSGGDYYMTASDHREQNPRGKRAGSETQELSAATAPQLHQAVQDIKGKIEDGTLSKGNVELAAILGSRPAQLALGRKPTAGMSANDLAEFLLTDPNLKIDINV